MPMLNAWPTASGRSRQASTPLTMSVDVAPGADLRAVAVDRQVVARERRLDEGADRAAADLARAEDVERVHRHRRQAELVVVGVRHVLAGELRDGVGPARLADRADRRDLALADVEGVRAEDLARREVDEPLERAQRRRARPRARCRCRSRSRASCAPGSSSTVSTPAIAAQWTKCVAPAGELGEQRRRRGRRPRGA